MKRLLGLCLFALTLIPAAAHAQTGRDVWEILDQTVPLPSQPGADAMRVSFSTATGGYATITTSTAACAGSATLVLAANASAQTSSFCNEGTISVRIGPSNISSTVGSLVGAGVCVGLDGPKSYFRSSLYCASTGATQKISTLQGAP